MPHSQFLGWHHRDRAKAIAFALEKSARCPSCGTADWEWKEDPDAYQAVHEFCLGCYRREAAQDADLPAGTTVVLIPTDSDEWRQAMEDMEARHRADSQSRRAGGV